MRSCARTAELGQPVRWSEVDERIAAAPLPPRSELEALFPPESPARWLLYAVLGVVLAVPLVASFGAGFVVLALVWAHTLLDRDLSDAWLLVARLESFAAVAMALAPLSVQASMRRRDRVQVAWAAGIALPSGLSVALLLTEGSTQGTWVVVRWLSAAAAVAGTAVVVFLLRRPAAPRVRREERRGLSLEDRWLQALRATVLEVLRTRGLVTQADLTRMIAMPRGAWGQLETLPDGRLVRDEAGKG